MNDETPIEFGVAGACFVRSRADRRFQYFEKEMSRLSDELQNIVNRIEDDPDASRDLKGKLKSIRPLIKSMLDEERLVNVQNTSRAGPAGEFALDLTRARSAIGERLARLRDAQAADGVSGQSG